MANYHTVTPAYGRDYKSKKAILEDWNSGKDFVFAETGQYCSKKDFADKPGTIIMGRYRKLTMITELGKY